MDLPTTGRLFIYGAGWAGSALVDLLTEEQRARLGGFLDTHKTGVRREHPIVKLADVSQLEDTVLVTVAPDEVAATCARAGVTRLLDVQWLVDSYHWRELAATREFIEDHMPRGGVAFDIGANAGSVSLLFRPLARSVFAFEPNPRLKKRLRTNVEPFANIRIVQAAVGARTGSSTLYLDDFSPGWGGSSLLKPDDTKQPSVEVDVVGLMDFCNDEKIEPDFIKLDAEGYEPTILLNAMPLIERRRPWLIFEFLHNSWRAGYEELFNALHEHYGTIRLSDGSDAFRFYTANAPAWSSDEPGHENIGCIPRN